MNQYRRHHREARREGGSAGRLISTVGIFLALCGLFILAVVWFRHRPAVPPRATDAPALAEKSVSGANAFAPSPRMITGIEQVPLLAVADRSPLGQTTRHLENGIFFHELVASLPTIDRAAFAYEAWLVRPVPFEYFATGEMVTDDAGRFVLKFEGDPRGAYEGYTQVVITLQKKGAPLEPGEHVAEGNF